MGALVGPRRSRSRCGREEQDCVIAGNRSSRCALGSAICAEDRARIREARDTALDVQWACHNLRTPLRPRRLECP